MPAAVVLNLLILAGTPIDGSHYFVDVFAGIALAAPYLIVARVIAGHAESNRSRSPIPVAKTPQLAGSE